MPDSLSPVDCSLPRSPVHGILQARILDWVAISFSTGHNDPSSKRSTEINTAEDVGERESSEGLGGNVNGEATMENSTEVP